MASHKNQHAVLMTALRAVSQEQEMLREELAQLKAHRDNRDSIDTAVEQRIDIIESTLEQAHAAEDELRTLQTQLDASV